MDLLTRFTDFLNSPQNKLSNKTVKNYKADIASFITWYKKQYNQELGITPINITSQIVDLYKRAKIQESNLSDKSVKRHLSSLRKFFIFLRTEGIISQDPFEQISISTEKLNYKPNPLPKSNNLNILNNIIWRLKGKPIFYSPLSTSIRKNPLYKKIWHYFYLAVFISFVSQLGLVINQAIVPKPESQKSVIETQLLGASTRLSPKLVPKEQLASPTLAANATGSAKFTNDVNIGGNIIASGSATFNKLNLSITGNPLVLSSKELLATGSAGSAWISPGETEAVINNSIITDKSLIYITPIGTPSGQTPFLMRQVPETSFIVGIASPSATNTPFNWLIIN